MGMTTGKGSADAGRGNRVSERSDMLSERSDKVSERSDKVSERSEMPSERAAGAARSAEDVLILGIESSCDDTSAAVIRNGVLLSNVTASQAVHESYGGVVPELASRAHEQNIVPVVDQALKRAGVGKEALSAIAFTRGPGLMGSLLVGVSFAKGMARSLGIPMVDVNHLQGHVLAHFIEEEGVAKANAEYLKTDKIIHSTIYTGFFERLIGFTGFENAAMDLIDEDCQEYVHKLFSKLADLYIEIIHRLHKYFNVEIVEVHDDWGNQRSLMFSVDTHREMVMPYMQRIADAAHAEGVFIEQHSCGKIEALIPNLIESRVDTWRGQSSVIDKKWCVDNYGDQFRFGVEIRPAEDIKPEDVMPYAKAILDEYHGKDVWIVLGRSIPGGKDKEIYEYIRSLGHI